MVGEATVSALPRYANHTEHQADDSDQSDHYEDEEEGLSEAGGKDYGLLRMRVGREPKPPGPQKLGQASGTG